MRRFLPLIFLSIFAAGCAMPFSAPPRPAYGKLLLDVEPASARVWLDGDYMGRVERFAGRGLMLAPGAHVLRLEHDDFASEKREVFAATEPTLVTIRMLPRPVAPEPAEK
ncbi:hypothetical protein K8I61_00725 [bacterium]|nr:hypothetical protein [bacterium]